MIEGSLISSYRDGNVILFVGAGVSKSLGLPTWSELVDQIAMELGYDPDVYKTLSSPQSLVQSL